jgi:hypothetical protein
MNFIGVYSSLEGPTRPFYTVVERGVGGSTGSRPAAASSDAGRLKPYRSGTIVWMKKTLHIDEYLLRDARSASGAKTDTNAVRLGP